MTKPVSKYQTLRAHLTSKTLSARGFAKSELRDKLWKRAKLEGKPGVDLSKLREGYEMRESENMTMNGQNVITMELWKRIDQETIVLAPKVEVVTVNEENKLEDLLK